VSQGHACRCKAPLWHVAMRKHNRSAFSGYWYTPSAYSLVACLNCNATWRTKARYVDKLPDVPRSWYDRGLRPEGGES